MATEDDLISLQIDPDTPPIESAETATSMVIAPSRAADRLRHFPEEIYDLRAESHLARFVKVLLGDAGANQVRKTALLARLRSTLQGSHFFDLDRFYGPLFGIQRSAAEALNFDPQVSIATTKEWDAAASADASFRSRIEQLAKGISYGPTPTGMELISEAVLSVDCDVYESYVQADASYQTVAEVEGLYGEGTPGGTLADMEGVPISDLEGAQLTRISGDERRVFTIRPKREITQREAYDLRRVLNRIKPAECRFVIDFEGVPLYDEVPIDGVAADSEHWEIISEVVSGTDLNSPYPISSPVPVEQPRPPFSGYQGEAWSYNSDIVGVSAATDEFGTISVLAPQRITYADGSTKDFSADLAVLPRRMVQSGRAVSDAVLVSHPYPGPVAAPPLYEDSHLVDPHYGLASLYVDGVPVEELVRLLQDGGLPDPFHQNPENRYWVTGERFLYDDVVEVLDIRLTDVRRINYLTFEVSRFPHRLVAEAYSTDGQWVEIYRHEVADSFPRVIPRGVEVTQRQGHPQHAHAAHWTRVGTRTEAVEATRIRLRLDRSVDAAAPEPPVHAGRDAMGNRTEAEVAYTLAVRSLDFGYRVTSRADFDIDGDGAADPIISFSRDLHGSTIRYRPHELRATNLLGEGYWRSEPQPVNYAVVNLHLDTRGEGDGQVIDRFYLDPTHVGCHLTIYFSNDPAESDGTEAFFADRVWTPIPRDYVLHKGFVHLPATRARYWKFEFTNLAIEPYESFVPITRRVRLFPRSLVEAMNRNYARTATEVPQDLLPALDAVSENLYSDALDAMGVAANPAPVADSLAYKATEALYFPALAQAAKAKDASWVFGFMPWHQSDRAPRFATKGRHIYENTEVLHSAKTAFFVGLREVAAYRARWEEDDDTQVYYDTLDDFRNLTPGFTWQFEPGYMTTGQTPITEAEVTSRVFSSRNNVSAVQFATVQAPPVQLVPDHDFRDPALATYEWSDSDYWTKVGDSQLIYSPGDHSVINVRRVVPQNIPITTDAGPTSEVVHPVFAHREYEAPDPDSVLDAVGGQATPPVGLSNEGRVYAAVRFIALTDLTSPLYLQIVENASGTVLAETELVAQKNQTVEGWVGYDIITGNLAVRARLIQRGRADDSWRVLSLALFEDSIVWEFSNNGGADWYPAQTIRNNDRGVLTFPTAGNALRYRARSSRPHQWISAIKIRPWYVGTKNARTTGTHRGPNVSVYDADVPIHEDPLFTAWRKPIPAWWFERRQTFQILPVEGAPNVTEYARFYGRPSNETVPEPTDSATGVILRRRTAEERLDFFYPVTDAASRTATYKRVGPDLLAAPADGATWVGIYGISKPIVNRLVQPVFSGIWLPTTPGEALIEYDGGTAASTSEGSLDLDGGNAEDAPGAEDLDGGTAT